MPRASSFPRTALVAALVLAVALCVVSPAVAALRGAQAGVPAPSGIVAPGVAAPTRAAGAAEYYDDDRRDYDDDRRDYDDDRRSYDDDNSSADDDASSNDDTPTTGSGTDPSYDHQTETYNTRFTPVFTESAVSVKPFFSPDHSIDTLTNFINSVSQGGTVDIGTPGFGSWSGCTPFHGCTGCNLTAMSQEAFPIFHAILNAVHVKGATVRLLTNNYNTPTCAGKISPLDWLSLNGVQVKYFDTVTFMHAKFITVDRQTSAVSSVNWSYTSFMLNREAGVIIGEGGQDLVDMAMQVYDFDFNQATEYVVTNTYTEAELAFIRNPAYQKENIPPPRYFRGAYVTPEPYAETLEKSIIYTSPDDARHELFLDINSTTTSFHLMMYQVTDMGLCQALQDIYTQKPEVDLRILVSAAIYDPTDCSLANQCYQQLHNAGMTIHLTPSYYSYSHQKFWIVDGDHVGMSTGNWSPSDYGFGNVYPPFGQSGWQKTNRDFNMRMWGSGVVSQFQKVMDEDQQRGSEWTAPFTCGQ